MSSNSRFEAAVCRRRLDRFVDPAASSAERESVRRHAADCPSCAAAIARFEAARSALAGHHAGLEPDPAFRARVLERVAAESAVAPALVWAARRVLPAAAALALVLSGWSAALDRPTGLESLLFGPLEMDAVAALVVSQAPAGDAQ